MRPETAKLSSDAATAEIDMPPTPETISSRPVVHGTSESFFNRSFWPKWIQASIAAILLSIVFYWYNMSIYSDDDTLIVIEFTVLAFVSSLIQWYVFRDRLNIGWIGTNTVAGIVLGSLHNILYGIEGLDWWSLHLGILLAVWLAGNFAFGRRLVGGA
jgi:hypothetical protein